MPHTALGLPHPTARTRVILSQIELGIEPEFWGDARPSDTAVLKFPGGRVAKSLLGE